jgi:hypothetical protein
MLAPAPLFPSHHTPTHPHTHTRAGARTQTHRDRETQTNGQKQRQRQRQGVRGRSRGRGRGRGRDSDSDSDSDSDRNRDRDRDRGDTVGEEGVVSEGKVLKFGLASPGLLLITNDDLQPKHILDKSRQVSQLLFTYIRMYK